LLRIAISIGGGDDDSGKTLMERYFPDRTNAFAVYGYLVSETLVDVLKPAGNYAIDL
jgi:hypothetical protein